MTVNLELIFGNWILANFAYFVYTSMAIATVSGFFYSYHFLTKDGKVTVWRVVAAILLSFWVGNYFLYGFLWYRVGRHIGGNRQPLLTTVPIAFYLLLIAYAINFEAWLTGAISLVIGIFLQGLCVLFGIHTGIPEDG